MLVRSLAQRPLASGRTMPEFGTERASGPTSICGFPLNAAKRHAGAKLSSARKSFLMPISSKVVSTKCRIVLTSLRTTASNAMSWIACVNATSADEPPASRNWGELARRAPHECVATSAGKIAARGPQVLGAFRNHPSSMNRGCSNSDSSPGPSTSNL